MRFPLQDAVMQNLEKSTWFEFMQCNSFHFTAHIIPILRARDYPPHSWSLPIFGKVFASFSKSAKKGGPTSVPASLRIARGFGAHQNLFRPASKSF